MNKLNKVAEIILKYESDFNGNLKVLYKDTTEFLKDLINNMKQDGVGDILEYYRNDFKSRNDTNSTVEQRKELKDIILILEGQVD